MSIALIGYLVLSTANPFERVDGGSRSVPEAEAGATLATAADLVSRQAVEGAVEDVAARSLDALFLAIADSEEHVVRGTGSESTASDLERAVAELAARERGLEDVVDRLSELGAVGAVAVHGEPEQLQRLRYGAVRAVYWLVPLWAGDAAGREDDPAGAGASAAVRSALSRSCALLVSIDGATADFLADNLVALLEGELAIEPGPRLLDELLTLRVRHRERANVIDRVLLALAGRLDAKTRDALARWLLADPSDTEAVTRGLVELFALGEPWLALDVARDTFERGGPNERHMVALAVAREAPVDMAVGFLVERAGDLGGVPTAWFELGERDGGLDELRLAYADLRVDETGDPDARRLTVLGMGGAEAPELRAIALDDPDPDVRGQALLTLTAQDGAGTTRDVEAILDALDREPGGSLSALLWASQNVLDQGGGPQRAPHTQQLVDRLRSLVLDDTRAPSERREVLEAIEAWIDPNERLWLWDVLGG
ncbi:hypothetical protein Pla163_05650 [Planctomycetes bacterium Pla163]|uniref:Uncharacterized protein n=1 Tax=Rohdeia mirabilis TaxID=2528008 RepID=A0A518CW64_9BACT|nr:hypothetical protein Pla163_05650 [Planctomycetes bacterium Pla163]